VVLWVAVTIGVPVHHAGDAQNMVGSVTVIAKWWAMCAGMPRDWWRRKPRLPSVLFPLAVAIVAWWRKPSDSSMNTPRYLIWCVAMMVLFLIRRGGCEVRLLFLSLLVRGRQYRSSVFGGAKVSPRRDPLCRCWSVLSSSRVLVWTQWVTFGPCRCRLRRRCQLRRRGDVVFLALHCCR